jgi:hypothetical protein
MSGDRKPKEEERLALAECSISKPYLEDLKMDSEKVCDSTIRPCSCIVNLVAIFRIFFVGTTAKASK